MKRIYYDVTTLEDHPIKDGIRRVSFDWLERLARRNPDEIGGLLVPVYCGNGYLQPSYNFLVNEILNETNPFSRGQRITIQEGDTFVVPSYDIFVPQMNFPMGEVAGKAKLISVIYDLLPISNPEWFPDEGVNDRFKSALDKQCFYSDRLIVNSRHVAENLKNYLLGSGYSNSIGRISVVPLLGTALKIGPTVNEKGELKQVLCVGTVEPRKGYFDLFEALLKMESLDFKVVIIGRLGWQAEKLIPLLKKCKRKFGKNFRWERFASDFLLESEYQNSDIVFCLSNDEGFGLPVVEALTRGLPCLIRDIPVFNEVSEGAAVTFGPSGDFADLETALNDLDAVIGLAHRRVLNFNPASEEENFKILTQALVTL